MGGNLFKAGRVDKDRYFEIVNSLRPALVKHFGIPNYRIPVAYSNKATYGDVDIILDAGVVMNKPNWFSDFCDDIGVVETKSVRNVKSMLYQNFQVDIFLVGTSKLNTCDNFMSYNILGNLIGRIYHKFNLRYGEDGLFYVLRGFNNHVSKEVIVSREMRHILEFVDLSYHRWAQGFNDLEDIFKYVISSNYFCADSYDLKYFNVQKRATERPDFNKFLDYLEKNEVIKNYPFSKDKDIYLPMIDEYFRTDLVLKTQQHKEKQEILKTISEKFNGKIVMELIPELNGKEMGDFIGQYKNSYSETFIEVILGRTQEEINKDIKYFYNTYYEK